VHALCLADFPSHRKRGGNPVNAGAAAAVFPYMKPVVPLTLVRGAGDQRAAAPTASDDGALVAAARDGDRVAFGRLYERHARMVHGLLLAHVPAAEAEDLMQDVFMQALRKLGALRDPAAFAPWLATITRNRAMDRHRLQRFAPAHARPAAGDHAGAPAEEALAPAPHTVLAAIQALVLRLVAGMTGPEIAARTGLTPESVRVNLHRGMKKLRARLAATTDAANAADAGDDDGGPDGQEKDNV
jgi:RNA polymerase sigma-70 factor (ECF subfamily)